MVRRSNGHQEAVCTWFSPISDVSVSVTLAVGENLDATVDVALIPPNCHLMMRDTFVMGSNSVDHNGRS